MGPCLSGRQFSPAPRDRKLLPSVCGSGRHSARDWASPPPHPYISLHPSPPPEQHRGWGGGRPLNPLTSLHGPWEQQSERDSSRPLHRHQQPLQKLKPKQTSCPPGPCLRNNHKNMTSTVPPAEGKAWPFAQVRVYIPARSLLLWEAPWWATPIVPTQMAHRHGTLPLCPPSQEALGSAFRTVRARAEALAGQLAQRRCLRATPCRPAGLQPAGWDGGDRRLQYHPVWRPRVTFQKL